MAQKTKTTEGKPVSRASADILDCGVAGPNCVFSRTAAKKEADKQERIKTRLFGLAVEGKADELAEQVSRLEKAGIDVKPMINAKYAVDYTMLMFASKLGLIHICELLVEKGADANAKNGYGWTASMVAGHYGHTETAAFLASMENKTG
jgi:hypothetical protein